MPVFLIAQILWKSWPGFRTVPSGMVTSPSKTLLSQRTPVTVALIEGDARGVNPGMGLAFGLKEIVGSAPEVVGVTDPFPAVGGAAVGSGTEVFVGAEVAVGRAFAVLVNCMESCATVVPTIDVLIALMSSVGAGAAPMLQPARINPRASMAGKTCLVFFRTAIFVPPRDAL